MWNSGIDDRAGRSARPSDKRFINIQMFIRPHSRRDAARRDATRPAPLERPETDTAIMKINEEQSSSWERQIVPDNARPE